jgi:hypothetical protein
MILETIQAIQEWVLCAWSRATRRPGSDHRACFGLEDRAQIGPMARAKQMAHISIPAAAIIAQIVMRLCLAIVPLFSQHKVGMASADDRSKARDLRDKVVTG